MFEHTDAQKRNPQKKLGTDNVGDDFSLTPRPIKSQDLNKRVGSEKSIDAKLTHQGQTVDQGEVIRKPSKSKFLGKRLEIMTPSKRISVAKDFSKSPMQDSAKLWLHIHLPQLPLDILTRGGEDLRACVLCEARANRRKVLLANSAAMRLGVRQGMPLNAAHILGDINVFEPNAVLERKALRQLCHWALQFSPVISEVDNDGLLIEIKGSLKLFNGIDRLIAEVKKGLKELGYKFAIAVAPTPLGATALARSGQGEISLNGQTMMTAVGPLPLAVLRLPEKQESLLDSIGVRTIGDCTRLPRGGLGRRASPELVKVFDRLAGQHPDPRVQFEPSKVFQSHVELPWETRKVQTLMLAGERLLQELTGYLRGVSGLANTLRWTFRHNDNTATHFQLELVKPSRDPAYFAMLFREKVARLNIQANVIEIGLYVNRLSEEQTLSHADLFDDNAKLEGGNQEDWHAFVDRLRTRLGDRAVKRLKAIADHRPECAWRWQEPNFFSASKPKKTPTSKDTLHNKHNNGVNNYLTNGLESGLENDMGLSINSPTNSVTTRKRDLPGRPVWLMRRPVKIAHDGQMPDLNGPLELQTQRERVETGWWDGKPVGRDYFVASNPAGARLWVYRELTGKRDWYLHGIFD